MTFGLSRSERTALRDLLVAERDRGATQTASLMRDYDGIVDAAEMSNADDEHDPEGATIAYERAQVGALLDQARANLAETDRALERMAAGTYGICERCLRPVPFERLAALPTTRRCVTCVTRNPIVPPTAGGRRLPCGSPGGAECASPSPCVPAVRAMEGRSPPPQ